MYDTIMMDVCHYIFIQIHRTCNTNGKPEGKLEALGAYDVPR